MRKLVVIEFMSLDGVVQAPGDPKEDTEGGFAHGGWQRPYFDDAFLAAAGKGMAETDAQVFGRKTYDGMAAFWPTQGDDDPFAKHLNHITKYVASRTMTTADWEVDEYQLMIHPLVLVSGKTFFRDTEQVRQLELVDVTPTTTGVLLTTYRPAR